LVSEGRARPGERWGLAATPALILAPPGVSRPAATASWPAESGEDAAVEGEDALVEGEDAVVGEAAAAEGEGAAGDGEAADDDEEWELAVVGRETSSPDAVNFSPSRTRFQTAPMRMN
jgi:hypothetical protein